MEKKGVMKPIVLHRGSSTVDFKLPGKRGDVSFRVYKLHSLEM